MDYDSASNRCSSTPHLLYKFTALDSLSPAPVILALSDGESRLTLMTGPILDDWSCQRPETVLFNALWPVSALIWLSIHFFK